eukprot:TRINITY_DN1403_c0_g1_i4.p1 TRINITY_DN1403_c0_g1~~TRINITY_DN1403_c0_g1_i4.p1  ORF type:complete len:459 (-),score=97.78 TRINITY_DN1403_c0_g1_i4:207-1583(-)
MATIDPCINTGDTTWVLISSILVLTMMPALAFFEAGLLRSINTVSLVTQIIVGVSVLSGMWHFFGYTLVFGRSLGGVIGNLENILMIGVDYNTCSRHAPNVPAALYGFFQMMFAAITPLLMTGAFAERMRFKAYMIYIILWEILIYYPVAHWIWGDGWMSTLNPPVEDFAGGIVIHTTAGAASLVCALVLGQRKDFDKYDGEFPPSNLPLAALGGALLWTSWFGFNAGSALSSGPLAVSTVVATQRAATCSGVVWLILSWVRGKPSAVATINGVIAGLAGITPASGYVDPQYGTVIGLVLGLSSYGGVYLLKHKLRIDDALDVSSVHGITGAVGAFMIGFFGQKAFNSTGADGLFFGDHSWRLLGVQTAAIVVSGVYAAIVTFIILKVIDRLVKLKLSEEDLGLDVKDHGEDAYAWSHVPEILLNVNGQILDTNETTRLLRSSAGSLGGSSRSSYLGL